MGENMMKNIKIDLGAWNGVFAVPNSVVDEHIKISGAAQLKVLLYILRHSDKKLSTNEIGKALSMHPADVSDSVNFWIDCGLLRGDGSDLFPADSEKANEDVSADADEESLSKPQSVRKTKFDTNTRSRTLPQRPDGPYIAQRILQDKQFAFLTEEAQSIIGKPLSTGDLGILLNLHDMDGLPVDVITMLLQFCVSRGKYGMKYIESVGMSWAQQGVDSISKAEEKIKEFSRKSDAWGVVSDIFGIKVVGSPTKTQLEFSNRWLNEWGFKRDAIRLAYETCVDNKGVYNLRYIDGIMKKWHKSGLHTVKEIEQRQTGSLQSALDTRKTSYDILQIENFDEFE